MEKKNIFLIESNDFTRKVVESDLIKAGYNVISVANHEEAKSKINDVDFEVIITELPHKDFGQTIEVIRKFKRENSEVKVIVATNYDSITQAVAALREGAHDYVVKPFNLDELKLVVENALEMNTLKAAACDAFHDELTNIYSINYFDEALKIELNRSQRYPSNFSVLYIDIDNFKHLIETYGKEVCDNVLKMLGEIIVMATRKTDCVCRYGPDEFAIILPETKKDGAFILGTRLLSLVRQETFSGLSHRNELTISIGLTMFPEDSKDKDGLIKKMHEALEEAKKLGKNRIVFF